MRPTKLKNYMEQAEVASKRSHDAETQVGAVLIKNDTGAVIMTSYNGFVRGADDDNLPNTRPDKYPYMCHAEENMIWNCARHGISTDNCSVVSTLSPCVDCMRMLWQCGISRVVVKEIYRDFDDITKMKDLTVKVNLVEDFYELEYKVGQNQRKK